MKTLTLRSAMLLFAVVSTFAQVNVTTQHNDLARTGQNLNETVLTPSNVNVNQFGLLFKAPVDNQVYAQPLYLANVSIGGGTHNVAYVATTSNSVYAFDADTGTQYWHVNLGTPIANTDYGAGCVDINGNAGIVGTPVIDPVAGTLYVVNSLNSGGAFSFMLHALNTITGADKAGSPIQITNSAFTPLLQNQRAALALSNGNVLVPFSSHCDMGSYHGFLFSFNASTLGQVAVFNTSPTGGGNSLWMSGQGPAVDSANNIYFGTSNGTWDGVSNFSESFIKLNPNLTLADWFTAGNHANLDGGDLDLDTSGPLLIPPGNRLMMVGKSATGYLVNSANLGHLGDATAVQTLSLGGALHGSAIYWNGAAHGPEVYVWAQTDNLKAFQFNGNTLNTPNFQTGPDFIGGEPGAYLSLSANGATNGIVWANAVLSGDANHGTIPGVLRAFDASNVATELYNNQQNAARDSCNNFAKNGYPTIANGKVYLGSFGTADSGSGQLCVYSVLPTNCSVPAAATGLTATAVSSSQINLSWTASTPSNCPISYDIFRSTTPGFTPSASNKIASSIFATTYSDPTTVASTTYNYIVEATTLAGASGPSNQASVTTPVGLAAFAINSGGGAASSFVADVDFNGGGASASGNTIDTSAVTNPAPQAVYQSERFGNFTYTIPGFNPGAPYTVRLHFAEFFWSMAGQRVFNVLINGTQVLTNFDIFAAAGAKNKAIVEQFNANANSSGQFVIQYVTVTDNAKASGIEITSNGSCSAPTTPSALNATAVSSSQINLSWSASTSSCAVSYTVFRSTTSGFTPSGSNQVASGVSGTSFSDTGLTASTTYFYLVEAVNSGGTSAASNQASATTQAGTGGGSVQINSGGPAVAPFAADLDFAGGAASGSANTIDTSAVTNPAPMAVYQTERFGNFTYTIPGLSAGATFTVRLHFAEFFWTTTGQRVFNVLINGTQVLTNFDIIAAAGAANKAIVEQFSATASSSGQIVIQFVTVTDNAKISGIEITPSASCSAPAPPSGLSATAASSSQINLSWSASTSSCPVTYKVFRSTTSGFTPSASNQVASGIATTSFSDTGLAASTTYFYLVEAVNTAGTSAPSNQASATTPAGTGILQINSGGPAVSPFVADVDFTGGATITHANTIDLSGVTNPAPMAVYQSARIGNFSYTLPGFAAGSSHTVRLHFAETFFAAAGSRTFNVSINGTQVLTNFDIFATAGAKNKALVEQFTVNANASGQYVIVFTTVINNSLVSGIEVR